ncbi:hypothetical protein OOZ54_12725 [Rhodopseudomonas palustris]|uniref:hypothetical protein n=1 Tax=Rhodopseudomonas palustris TaxID=1076 RepID=UPI0022F123A9|nr:hypothetical protein [Rhodopseudomonas palustris]WBU27559.1 hypothetical protein OOZ54_12725 [Rhodopseudomonas palustris]
MSPKPIAELNVAKRYIAQAVPLGDGGRQFRAIWAAPGQVPNFVYEGDDPEIFLTAEDAEAKARKVLFEALNTRRPARQAYVPNQPGLRRAVKFLKMTGEEFAVAQTEADLTDAEIAFAWGTTPDRVVRWKSGADAVPFAMHWVLPLLKNDKNYEFVLDVAEQKTVEK